MMNIKTQNHNYEITLVEYNEGKGTNIYTDHVERPYIRSSDMKFFVKQIERNGYYKSNDNIVPHPDNFDDIKNISWKVVYDDNRPDCYIEVTDKYNFTHEFSVLRYKIQSS